MSNPHAENPADPAYDPIVLRRMVLGSSSRIRVNVVSKGGNSPSARSAGTLRDRARWTVIILMLLGLGETLYGVHATRSSMAAAPLYRGSASCHLPRADSVLVAPTDVCRNEPAVIVARTWYSSRNSSRSFYLETVTPDGRRDKTVLAGRSLSFWRRVQPTERVTLQRFVAPGYYLTGKITALADSQGIGLTRFHPDSGSHRESGYALMGIMIFVSMLVIYVRSLRVGPR